MTRRLAVVAAVLALAGTACSLPGTKDKTPPAAPAGAGTGGVLRVGTTRPAGIDPIEAYEPVGKLIVRTMCDTLLTIDPVTGELQPGLVRDFVVASDGSAVTLRLRRNLTASDGTTLDTADALYSLSRLASLSNASYAARLLSNVAGFDELNNELLGDPGDVPAFTGIERRNKTDFQIRFETKSPAILRALAEPATALVSESAASSRPREFGSHPVCAGPYRLTSPYRSGDQVIRLERTPGYHAANVGYTGGGRGYADAIEFHLFDTADAAVAAFRKGSVDVVAVAGAAARDAGADLVTADAPSLELVGLPVGVDGPYANVTMRKALSLAIDRESLVRTVWGPTRTPATGYLPPALGKVSRRNACGIPLTGDPAAARAAFAAALSELARADIDPSALPLTLAVNDDHAYPAMAAELARQWRSVLGLQVTVRPMRWRDYSAKAASGLGFDTAFRVSWSADAIAPQPSVLDPEHVLGPLFVSTSTSLGNWGHWANGEFDTVFTEDAVPEFTELTRRQRFQDLEDMVCAELPAIPLAFGRSAWLVRKSAWDTSRPSYLSIDGVPMLREMFVTG